MTAPTGPFLASVETVDTVSTDGANCIYPAAPLGGAPLLTTVGSGGSPISIITPAHVPTPIAPVKVNPLNPIPCNPGTRSMKVGSNTTVYFNGQLPCVASAPPLGGDETLVAGAATTPRPLTGPFQCPTIIIGSNI